MPIERDLPWWVPPVLAVQFLTRLPVPATTGLSPRQIEQGLARAVVWFPLVGTVVGAITAGVAAGGGSLWPAAVAATLALIVEARLTGAFHEDAVADFCDAFGGGATGDDVRRIMKDSRIGSYGALGLLLAVLLRLTLTTALLTVSTPWAAAAAIIAAATFARLMAVMMMASIAPAAAAGGLAKDIGGRVGGRRLGLAVLLAAPGLAGFAIGAPLALAAAIGAGLGFVWWFRGLLARRIGGSTGDCLGFAAYAGQLLLLLAATAR